MISNKVVVHILFMAVFCLSGIPGGNNCWAPPLFYGPQCKSNTAIFGYPDSKIVYSIEFNGNTLLCCKAFYCPGDKCRHYDIGCSSGNWRTRPLSWGNNLAQPSLQCKGVVLGALYSFKH